MSNNPIQKLMGLLPARIDCAIIQSDVNRRYFTGMLSSAGTVVCFRDASYLIIDFRYIEKARQCVTNCRVIEQHDLMFQIQELLRKHGAKTAAVESMTMTLHDFAVFQRALEKQVQLDRSDVLSRAIYDCRTVKTPEEIEKIRKAQRIAEAALAETLNYIRVGVSERDIMLYLNHAMLQRGSEGESFPTIALTGARTSMPHGVPTAEAKVQSGDFVLMDFGAMVDGYHSDMTRTVCVGQPTERMREVYGVVLRAQEETLRLAKVGVTGKEMDACARKIITDAGYGDNFGHSLGHGVGMEIHEFPNASPASQAVMAEGNVVTVEPGIYLPGEFGVRIEDFVVIHEGGCENLTEAPKQLMVL